MKQYIVVAYTTDAQWVSYGCYNTAKEGLSSLQSDYEVIPNTAFCLEITLPKQKKDTVKKMPVIKITAPKEKK